MPATISGGFATMLASRSLTLCWILKITRADSTVLAFTDHDQALTIDGQLYQPAGGLSGGSISQSVGTTQDTGDLTALLSNVSGHIERADVLNGLYTSAAVSVGLADWATPGNGARYLGPMQITSCVVSEGNVGLTIDTLDVLLKVDSIPTVTARCPVASFGDLQCDPSGGTVLAANQETLTVASVATDGFGQQVITFTSAPRIGGFFTRGKVKFATATNTGNVGVTRQAKYHKATEGAAVVQYAAGHSGGGSISPFIADSGYTGGTPAFGPTGVTIDTSKAASPAPTDVYQFARGNGQDWGYVLTGLTAGGFYWLRLHFAEWYYGASLAGLGGVGSRLFDVVVNGRTALSYFDITQAAGGQQILVIEEFAVTADGSGDITITFVDRVAGGLIAALELLPLTDTATVLTMFSPFPYAVTAGDTALLTMGCDRSYGGGCSQAGNTVNFRGLGKDLPGADAISQIGRG